MAFGFLKRSEKETPAAAVASTDGTNENMGIKEAQQSITVVQVGDETINDVFLGDEAARAANDHEQSMTMKYTIKYYSIAMVWAALMAAPIIMEGYETAMVPNFFSYRSFRETYGSRVQGKEYVIPTVWQSGITVAAACGALLGLWIAPHVVNRLGYRLCSVSGFIWAGFCLMIPFWSMNTNNPLPVFLVGEMLLGVPWGVFQGITLPYVSDITPLKLKGPATTMINIFWLIGQLSAAGVMIGTSTIKNVEWSIKAPMIIQYSWLIPLMFVALLAPESPLYLSRNNRDGLAKETLRRLNKDPLFNAEGSLAVIHAVNRHEEQTSADMGIRGCFRGMNLRRTEIALITYVTQQWVGTPLMSYSLKLLQKGGLTESHSLALTIGMYFLCIISTLCSMAAMRSVGRRKLWMGGLIAEIACLVSIGSMSFFLEKQPRMSWSIAACLLCFGAIYNFTIGPVCYTIVAETPATRLKAATNSVARGTYIIFAITNLFLVPNLLEDRPTGWGLGAKSAFVWACTATVCLIWAYFRLPEMKDLSPAQVDILFEKGVPARSWSTAVVPVA